MDNFIENADAVVIGGGLAGLTAGTLLARQGKKTVLLERSHLLGGRAQTRNHNGYQFNIGPHALYRSGRAVQVLKSLGIEPKGRVPLGSGGFAINRGRKHTLPVGSVSLLTTSLFGLSAKLETARLLRSIGRIDPAPLMDVTAQEWIESSLSDPVLRNFVMALFCVATYVNVPDELSAGVAIAQLQMALTKSVLYLDGGWQTLVDQLVEKGKTAGLHIITGAAASLIKHSSEGDVRGIRLQDGRTITTQIVIATSSPSLTARLVPGVQSLERWAAQSRPVRMASLDVALSELPEPRATFALGVDAPLYFSVHSATARLAPEGGAVIHAAKYLAGSPEDSAVVRAELENLFDLVQPGWRDKLVYNRFLPDLVVSNSFPTAVQSGLSGRPGPVVDEVSGLFLAGDWVGPEGLLADASVASACRAAEMAVSFDASRPAKSLATVM